MRKYVIFNLFLFYGIVLSYLYGSGECEFGKVKKLGAYNDSILIHKKNEF